MLVVPRVCVSRGGGRAFLGARSKLDGGERSRTRRHYAKEMVSSVILGSLDGQRWSHSGHVAEELFLRDRVRQSLTDVPLYRKKYLAGQLSVTASSLLEHASFRLSREPDWYPVFSTENVVRAGITKIFQDQVSLLLEIFSWEGWKLKIRLDKEVSEQNFT